jgi:hypothetical protein
MKTNSKRPPNKLGGNQKEVAVKSVRPDANFKQSRDVREDRGTRQMKTSNASATR